ncbi:MAG: phosphoenolpyruvate carboxykinase [Anaerolineales bacterium]
MGKEPHVFKFLRDKVIIHSRGRMCETPDELLTSAPFREFLRTVLQRLAKRNSRFMGIFGPQPEPPPKIDEECITLLIQTLQNLAKLDRDVIPNILPDARVFFRDPDLLNDFVEYLYNAWRDYDRFIIISGLQGDQLDERPYRTFNETVEQLTHLVRGTYRDIQENLTRQHPQVYRQARAGADIATIVSQSTRATSWIEGTPYNKLKQIPIVRQVLLYPPLVLDPPMNRRTGRFRCVDENPLLLVDPASDEWICYPAKVGRLLILVYIHEKFLELGLSLCNLFKVADDEDLERQPDAIYMFGVPGDALDHFGTLPTIFYDDSDNGMLVGAVPNADRFGYFGYLKKMVLTLHNIKMMKRDRLPFHGALVKIRLNNQNHTILLIGDSGAGKSETLEAFRILSENELQDMIIIADDMGAIDITDGDALGYGTEIGAFIRLDDLQPGYEFGQMGRAIFMSPSKTNARLLLPVTTYPDVVQGNRIDLILYANNYESVDKKHPIIERFETPTKALKVFKEGKVMSKGTTTAEGIVQSYFANVFGPPQYRELHDRIARRYFDHFFAHSVFVGQIRTRLGIPGWETKGPEEAAKALIRLMLTGYRS